MDHPTASVIPTKEAVHQALKEWNLGDSISIPLDAMLLYQQTYQNGPDFDSRSNESSDPTWGLTRWPKRILFATKFWLLRFVEQRPGHEVARTFSFAEGHFWRKQSEAIQRLTEILQDTEAEARARRLARFAGRLEAASYTLLFGRETHLARAARTVRSGQARPGSSPLRA